MDRLLGPYQRVSGYARASGLVAISYPSLQSGGISDDTTLTQPLQKVLHVLHLKRWREDVTR